ncbi:MAG: 16S rRNA (guanine(527)-N(7))-methyltransferase RsmG [Pseudomonadota bacterium]
MHNSPFELLNSHISVSPEVFERLKLYHNTLIKWQEKINLVSKDTLSDVWQRHFLDSLQLINFIEDKNKIIVDLGSGAGFPGMALAIAGYKNIHLLESDSRKVAFLREVARITETKISIHNCRIENNPVADVDIFISRACASLEKLFSLIEKSVTHETTCLFHKGKNYSIENENALLHYRYDMNVTPSVVDSHGVVLKIANIRRV